MGVNLISLITVNALSPWLRLLCLAAGTVALGTAYGNAVAYAEATRDDDLPPPLPTPPIRESTKRHAFVPGIVATNVCQAPHPFRLGDSCYLKRADAIHDDSVTPPPEYYYA